MSLSWQVYIKARTSCKHSEVREQPVESTPSSEAAEGKELLAGFNRLPPMEIL